MNHGLDTGFLVAAEVVEHAAHSLLDTLLAATYYQAGILSILTTNPSDFTVFGVFTCITPGADPSRP